MNRTPFFHTLLATLRRKLLLICTVAALTLAGCSSSARSPIGGFDERPYDDRNYGQPAGDPLNRVVLDLAV